MKLILILIAALFLNGSAFAATNKLIRLNDNGVHLECHENSAIIHTQKRLEMSYSIYGSALPYRDKNSSEITRLTKKLLEQEGIIGVYYSNPYKVNIELARLFPCEDMIQIFKLAFE